jgi:hypothetical protein
MVIILIEADLMNLYANKDKVMQLKSARSFIDKEDPCGCA